jgi:hypothetical protein
MIKSDDQRKGGYLMMSVLLGVLIVIAWIAVAAAIFGVVLGVPLGLLVLVVLATRRLLRTQPVNAHDPRWIAAFDAAAGVLLMLATTGAVPRVAGAVLAVGAAGAGTPEVERIRSLLFAFLAGIGVVLAPVASIALGISAGWRWIEHEPRE